MIYIIYKGTEKFGIQELKTTVDRTVSGIKDNLLSLKRVPQNWVVLHMQHKFQP
jgi:hypothetical protein